ncbi:MAG: 4-hydroxybenzoate octaprenyltransferase [Granulosicoccaceae bacterium]
MDNTVNHLVRQSLWARRADFFQLTRMNKPIGILLLGWSMLWGLWIAAEGWPGWKLFLIFSLGTVLTRAAGCCINDYADRHVDGHVKRTQQRPLASGRVSENEALAFTAGLMFLAFLLVLMTNTLTIQLSFLALALALIYPFCKRWTHWPQVVLGAAFGMSIPMAFAATTNSVPGVGWVLFVLSVIWSVAYDTMYAMVDRDDDLKLGLKSTAILFGRYDVLIVMLCQAAVLLGLMAVGQSLGLGLYYYLGLLVAAGTVVYQYTLIKGRQREPCFAAFLNNHYTGMAVFAGLFAHYALSS